MKLFFSYQFCDAFLKDNKNEKIALILLTALSISANAQTKQSNMKEQKNYTIMLLMNATAKWLSLNRAERSAFLKRK